MPTINFPYKQVFFLILGTFTILDDQMMAVLFNFIATRESVVLWQVNWLSQFCIIQGDYFWTNVQGKFELRNHLVASYYFDNMGKIRRSVSLSEAYDFCSIAARLPIVFLYFQGFLVSLSLICKRRRCKKTTAAAQVHKTHSQ